MILDWMILASLVAEVVLLSRLDRRRFGTWATPFTLLGYPYAVVAVLAYFLAPVFDFVPLDTGSVVVWIIGLFILWAAGAFLGWGLLDLRLDSNSPASRFPAQSAHLDDDTAIRWAVPLAWAAMPLMLYGVVISVKEAGGWTEIGSTEFRDAFSHGLHAHAVVLAMLLTVLLIGVYRRGDKRLLATIAMLLVFLTLTRVKGTIIQAVIGGLLFRMMRGQFQLTFKKVALVLLSTYVIFNVVYLLGVTIWLSDDPFNGAIYSWLGRHYLYYLFAGVLGFSEAMRSGVADVGGDWQALFAPFINVYHALFGGPLLVAGSAHEKGMHTDLLAKVSNEMNVYTFFGTLHLYLGVFGAALYVFVAGLLCYGFLLLVKKKRNVWLTASYCLIAGQLALGFFELYFWYLNSYEVIVLGAILAIATKSRWHLSGTGQPVAS